MSDTEIVQSEINTLSEDVFDALMGDAPPGSSASADNIIGGGKEPEEKEVEQKPKSKKTVKEEDVSVKEKSEEDISKEIDSALEDEDVKKVSKKKDGEETSSESDDSYGDFFKAQAEGLIERGLWFDFEGKEDFEWTEENYGKLIELQAQWKAEEEYNNSIEATGPYGKAIIDFIKNGGNPENVIDLFKQMKETQDIDISTEAGKEELLRRYYVDELGWSRDKFNRNFRTWTDTGLIEDEVKEANELLQERIKERIEEEKQQQLELQRQQKEAEANFASNMTNVVSGRKDLSPKEKQEVLKSLLEYNHQLPNGRRVNQFTLDFMKLQSDPEQYLDFVLYTRNPQKYKQNISKEAEVEVTKKNWNLIKGAAALQKNTGGRQPNRTNNTKEDLKIDYRSILDS